MSWEAATWASQQRGGLPPAEKFLLLQMANWSHPDGTDHVVFSSKSKQDELAHATNQSSRTVRRQLLSLEDRGLITRQHQLVGPDRIVLHGDVILTDTAIERDEVAPDNLSAPPDLATTYRPPVATTTWPTVATLEKNYKQELEATTTADGVDQTLIPTLSLVEPLPVDRFEEFWKAYPRKVGKGTAERAWAKAVKTTPGRVIIEDVVRRLPWFEQQKENPRGDMRPYPGSWLNDKRWTDEPEAPAASDQAWKVSAPAPDFGPVCGECERPAGRHFTKCSRWAAGA